MYWDMEGREGERGQSGILRLHKLSFNSTVTTLGYLTTQTFADRSFVTQAVTSDLCIPASLLSIDFDI
jgi:hypothetical protein